MGTPFFSIVIPTRDRPQLILDAVISSVDQQFHSFEVILSDNSSDDKTLDTLRASGHVSRITCIRPPREMAMPDHWEFATSQAKGEYVLVLTDRSILKQGALSEISRALSAYGPGVISVCSWRWSLFDDASGAELPDSNHTENPTSRILSSQDVVAAFVGPQEGYPYSLPRAMNSCYSAGIAAKIRAQHGRLFFPLSPDFTSAFLMLAHVDQLLYIDTPLFISRGLSSSTGGNAYRSDATNYLETLELEDWYRYVPIKASLVENFLFQDFLAMRTMAGGALHVEIDWVEYFGRCYKEILGKQGQNIFNKQQITLLKREWERALKDMDNDTQRGVRFKLRCMRQLRMQMATRQLLSDLGLLTALRKLRKTGRSPSTPRTTALKAAGHRTPVDVGIESAS